MDAASETSTNNYPFVWNTIISAITQLLSEEDSAVSEVQAKKCNKKLDGLIQDVPKMPKHLVPVVNQHSEEYRTVVEDCKCYNTCLFGHLVAVSLRDTFANKRQQCLNMQVTLLNYLWTNDPILYHTVLSSYIESLRNLCDILRANGDSPFQPVVLKWFEFTCTNPQLVLPKIHFKVNNNARAIDSANLILMLLTSQTPFVSSLCTSVSSSLWNCSLPLLPKPTENLKIYKFVSHLMRDNDLPDHESTFSPIVHELLLRVLNYLAVLSQTGKLPNEEDFCSMLGTLTAKLRSDTCFDYSYVESVYLLLLQSSSAFAESTEDALLEFVVKLLLLGDYTSRIDFDSNASCLNLSILVAVLRGSMIEEVRHMVKNKIRIANFYQSNKRWRYLLNQTADFLTTVSGKQTIGAFKLVRSITGLTVEITYQFQVNITFFDDELRPILSTLVNIFKVDGTPKSLRLLLEIVRDMLMLNETRCYDENTHTLLLQLLTLSWLPSIEVRPLSKSLRQKCAGLADAETREFCVASLMRTHRFQFEKWRQCFFMEIIERCSAAVFDALPLLVYSLNDYDLEMFVKLLLSSATEVLTAFAARIRLVTCAVDNQCVLTKLPKSELQLYCRSCDRVEALTAVEAGARRTQLASQLIVELMTRTDNAKRHILAAIVSLFNHIPKSVELLDLLRQCFHHTDRRIRQQAIKITPFVLFKDPDAQQPTLEVTDAVFRSWVRGLHEVALEALVDQDEDTQYVCVMAITQIGCVPLESTLWPAVCMVLNYMISAASGHTYLAVSCLQQIAIAHRFEVEDHVYLKYRERVFPIVARLIVDNYSRYKVGLTSMPCELPSILNRQTVNYVLPYLLPYVVRQPSLRPLIDELAALCHLSVPALLTGAFKYVLPHVFLFESAVSEQALKIITEETGCNVTKLLSDCYTKVLAELFIHYEEHEVHVKYVMSEIKIMSSESEEGIGTSDALIEQSLRSRFFGVLMKLENQLCKEMMSNTTRRRLLSSFKSLIQFMSTDYITSVRFKVLFTLRTITSTEQHVSPAQCVDVWHTFVRRVHSVAFGPIVSTIFVSLLPLARDGHKAGVNAIFRYVLIEHGDAIADQHLRELYFLERSYCDDDIYERARVARRLLAELTPDARLEWLVQAARHEVAEIKLHALRRLRHELAVDREHISRLILASDAVNRLVFRVLDVLVEGFRNVDAAVRQASGACLGEFGAIDPSYIPNLVIKEDDSKNYTCYQIDDVKFVVNAFTLLCRGFQMAGTGSNMDRFALAIQKLLALYEVTRSEECRYWRQVPAALREIIQPFYSTTYTLMSEGGEAGRDYPHLVYGTQANLTVQDWAYRWSSFLISLLPDDSKAKKVFRYCKGPMSCEIKCMYLFLPHILLNAVLAADDANLARIYDEMISVVKHDPTYSAEAAVPREPTSTQLMICEELSVISHADVEMGVICTKTIFNLLDVLQHKLRSTRAASGGRLGADGVKLERFLGAFSRLQLAQKSFDRKEYVRSLLYLEEHLEREDVQLDSHLVLLAKIYVQLNDVDNVKGLFAAHAVKLRQLQNVIMLHEITDQFQDAAICYQQLLKTVDDDERALFYEKRMIQCYLAMNQPETALRFVNSLSPGKSKHAFADVECEALWNLGQYDKLERLTAGRVAHEDDNWGVRMGRSIVHLLHGDRLRLQEEVDQVRSALTKSLHMSTAAFGGYRECYEHAVKLHILNELEKVGELVFSAADERVTDVEWRATFASVVQAEFGERLNKLQPTSRVLQPVLNMRQALFTVAGRLLAASRHSVVALFNEEIRRCWLKVIEIANRTRNFQLAYSNIIAVDNYQLKGFFIEKAKYYWEKLEQQEALRTLQHGLRFHYPDYVQAKSGHKLQLPDEDRKICAEALMLLGTYNDAVANADCLANLDHFLTAYKVLPHSEKTLVTLAQYQEKIIGAGDRFDHPEECVSIVDYYGKSLAYGCEFIYQSLSKMLNIWLDLAERWAVDQRRPGLETVSERRRKSVRRMSSLIQGFLETLPAYYFMTAFSLIKSRFLHPIDDCFSLLQSMIIRCVLAYPNQSLWQFMSLAQVPQTAARQQPGADNGRVQKERVTRVLNHPDLARYAELIRQFKDVFAEFSLLSLASKHKNLRSGKTKLTTAAPDAKLLRDGYYDRILIPAQQLLTIVLPRAVNDRAYNPYPEKVVTIAKVRCEAYVYSSMQRPLRVTLVGTDGRDYPMIFKAMDDLRIDSRAMEFNAVVNMYLKRDPEARDRGLRVRTYTVLPLYGNNGLIEFIPNLEAMRSIANRTRAMFGLTEPTTLERSEQKDSLERKRRVFRAWRDAYQPKLHEWFRLEFPNPSSWYAARAAYVRTLAVMSVVGYVLGLGDRHNDNILLDQTNGDVVHVDFNALFNRGETLAWPERVPFRLTHSMVKAMGPLGYEGGFRCTCETVNRVIRGRKEQLISVLNTFLYDPSEFVVDMSRGSGGNRRAIAAAAAAEKLRDLEQRMSGVVRVFQKSPSMPLSVEGQISRLIEEATDEDNLCQMFHGWAAFM